jgi:hypothetical protein
VVSIGHGMKDGDRSSPVVTRRFVGIRQRLVASSRLCYTTAGYAFLNVRDEGRAYEDLR